MISDREYLRRAKSFNEVELMMMSEASVKAAADALRERMTRCIKLASTKARNKS
jgi:hypothetical protein